MISKILIATNNSKKLNEISSLFHQYEIEIISLKQANIEMDPEETGSTFEENAKIKATAFGNASTIATLADDSGIEVDALGGRPGVFSARYSGKGATDESNIEKLLKELEGIPFDKRTARYKVVFALSIPGRDILTFEGILEGYITESPKGSGGFGYDPIFFIPQFNCTAAEISQEQKNSISHRKIALEKLLKKLSDL